ncbi:MAG: helix-turn-helix domain-containing protein [Anaerolineae bacterium]
MSANPIGTDWISTRQGATLTGYCREYVTKLAKAGRIRGMKLGHDWVVNREDLEAFKRKMQALGTSKHNPFREDLQAEGRGRGNEQGQ